MDSSNNPEFSSNPPTSTDPPSGSVAWCFLPVKPDQPGQCSRGFREFFELDDSFTFRSPLRGSSLETILRQKKLPVDLLFGGGANDDVLAFGQQQMVSLDELTVTSETVFDDSGLPTGRMLVFERTLTLNLPGETVERLQQATRRLSVLSPRETEILSLVYDGLTNKAIGLRSSISEKTVEKHRSNIMHKLGLQNSSQLIRCVSEARLGAELSSDGSPDTDE